MSEAQTTLGDALPLEVVESPRRESASEPIRCPDCERPIGPSKGGHPLPEDCHVDRVHGWRCRDCNNVIPANCSLLSAPSYNESILGTEVKFRDGEERLIPVPRSELERKESA